MKLLILYDKYLNLIELLNYTLFMIIKNLIEYIYIYFILYLKIK